MAQQPDDYLPSPNSANLKPPQFARFRLANLDPTAQEEQNEAIRKQQGMAPPERCGACRGPDNPTEGVRLVGDTSSGGGDKRFACYAFQRGSSRFFFFFHGIFFFHDRPMPAVNASQSFFP